MAPDLLQGRPTRRVLRLVAYLHRILVPGRRQIRALRVFQVPVWGPFVPQHKPHGGVPRRERISRVLRRHGPLPVRSDQGAHADHPAAVCA